MVDASDTGLKSPAPEDKPAKRVARPVRRRSIRMMPLFVMAAVLVIGVGFAVALAAWVTKLDELKFEGAKDMLEVGVVAVAAALLSFVADGYKHAQEERRFREDFLKDTLKRITASYNKSKAARRIARARGLIGSPIFTHVRVAAYDKFMRELNGAQLELEAVERDLDTSAEFFPSDYLAKKHIQSMQEYLGHIISEYEGERPKVEETNPSLSDVGQFAAFVDPNSKADFKIYSTPHRKVRDAIKEELHLLAEGKSPKAASQERRRALDGGVDNAKQGEED